MSVSSTRRHFPTLAFWGTKANGAPPIAPSKRGARHGWRIGFGSAVVPLSVVAGLMLTPLVRLTTEYRAQIKTGMSQAEVEAIVGGPPGDYDAVSVFQYDRPAPFGKGPDGLEWSSSQGTLDVVFDGRGGVFSATFYPGHALEYDAWWFIVERLTRSTQHQWISWWIRG